MSKSYSKSFVSPKGKSPKKITRDTSPNTGSSNPGNLLRVYIPAGAEIKVANLFEITSPEGFYLNIRLPFLEDDNNNLNAMMQVLQGLGGKVNVVKK